MRIIINNQTDISDERALALVTAVVEGGRISATGKVEHYCHVTLFDIGGHLVHCTARHDKTVTFTITREAR